MSQHDYVIANGTGAAVRSDLNGALAAIVSQNSGSTEPTTTYAYMPWADTSAGVMKIRNGANNAWITLYQLDGEYSTVALENGTAAAPSLYFKDSGTDTGVYSPGTDQVGITTGGTVRLTTSTTAFTGTLPWRGQDGTAAAPAVSFNSDTDTGIYSIGANQLGVATNGVERVNVGTTEVVWNDSGADIDFRVEGDTKANLFKIDAGTDTVSVDGTFATGSVNYPTEGSLSGRNKILNGGMAISQRNGTSSVNVSADSYTMDRWLNRVSGGGVITNQQTTSVVPTGHAYALALTVQTADSSIAAGDVYQLGQRIEGFNTADLAWGTASASSVTLSFWVRSSVTGTYGVGLQSAANTRSYVATYTINAANTWEYKTINIAGDTSGSQNTGNGIGIDVIFDLGSGTSSNATAGSWGAGGSYWRTSGCVNWISTASATFYITGVQLEAGSVATPFERRSYGQELVLCQRYYQKSYDAYQGIGALDDENNASIQIATSTTRASSFVRFGVEMRTDPTMTAYSVNGTSGGISAINSTATTTTGVTFASNHYSPNGFQEINTPGSLTAGNHYQMHWTASAEL